MKTYLLIAALQSGTEITIRLHAKDQEEAMKEALTVQLDLLGHKISDVWLQCETADGFVDSIEL